jgi:hypothetical protein
MLAIMRSKSFSRRLERMSSSPLDSERGRFLRSWRCAALSYAANGFSIKGNRLAKRVRKRLFQSP